MTVDVLFVHGAGDGAYEADAALAASLARRLGDGFTVRMPRMPADDDGDDTAWSAVIDAALAEMRPPMVLVGHSRAATSS